MITSSPSSAGSSTLVDTGRALGEEARGPGPMGEWSTRMDLFAGELLRQWQDGHQSDAIAAATAYAVAAIPPFPLTPASVRACILLELQPAERWLAYDGHDVESLAASVVEAYWPRDIPSGRSGCNEVA